MSRKGALEQRVTQGANERLHIAVSFREDPFIVSDANLVRRYYRYARIPAQQLPFPRIYNYMIYVA